MSVTLRFEARGKNEKDVFFRANFTKDAIELKDKSSTPLRACGSFMNSHLRLRKVRNALAALVPVALVLLPFVFAVLVVHWLGLEPNGNHLSHHRAFDSCRS